MQRYIKEENWRIVYNSILKDMFTVRGNYYLQMQPTILSSYIDGTRVGFSRVPLGPDCTDMLNGSCIDTHVQSTVYIRLFPGGR